MLVKESLKHILKPKPQIEIDNKIDIIIKDFIDGISIKDFEDFFLETQMDVITPKKFILPNRNYVIVTTEEQVSNAIDYFAIEDHASKYPDTSHYSEANINSFLYLWEALIPKYGNTYYNNIIQRIYDLFSKKFHLEW